MSKAIAVVQGPGKKTSKVENQDTRTVQINLPPPKPVDIEFNDISLKVSEGCTFRRNKTILKGISGLFKSGELTAIMGPSGAGKSSLMNALTGFSTKGVTGRIRAGDCLCELRMWMNSPLVSRNLGSLKEYRKKSCYILQDDRLNPLFTVNELMTFAADMKLGNTLNDKTKLGVINDILNSLGLAGTRETRCGNLSGGQKKRLSIAVELIDNPPVVFLDEPTTGLDSLTSTQCMKLLKKLAREGRTIVCTIHQPTASIYSMFDQVYILAEGMCIYQGPSEDTVRYLATVDLHCPKYHNPADYVLEIATGEYGNLNEMLASRQPWRGEATRTPTVTSSPISEFSCDRISILVNPPHELYKFGVLFKRCIKQQYRDWTTTHLKVMLHIVFGVLLGLLFENAGNDASKTLSNLGYLLVSSVYLSYTSLMPAILKFPSELPVVKKETFNNWYYLRTYYAAVLVTGIPMQIWYSFVYSTPSYILSGQPLELTRFCMFVLVLATVTLLADALGNVIGSTVNPVNGTFLGAIMICTMIVFAGFLILFSHMSSWMRAVSQASFLRYSLEALVLSLYGYDRSPMKCPETALYCPLRYSMQVLTEFSMKQNRYWIDVGILFGVIFAVRILAYYSLKRAVKLSA
ncbi:ATP-binding cassette sub-family G member 4 [Bombyx mori]|uniref:ABC transporter domain-containing protein n=1 Tax=Bombyx mori TaxID=7091 RepID=A0A8R2G8L4_BOMMO|nr:ATP-binding cassette sub-family G member 4 [Bombyx mori]